MSELVTLLIPKQQRKAYRCTNAFMLLSKHLLVYYTNSASCSVASHRRDIGAEPKSTGLFVLVSKENTMWNYSSHKTIKMTGIRNRVRTAVQASDCSSVSFSIQDRQIYMTDAIFVPTLTLTVSGLFIPRYFRCSEQKFPVRTFTPRKKGSS